ncbi:NAD(P)-dependent oxidoreductase [Streptomyces sp. M19]
MAGRPEARLVHLGSAAEYGTTEAGHAVTEATPPARERVRGDQAGRDARRHRIPSTPSSCACSTPRAGRAHHRPGRAARRRTAPRRAGDTVRTGDLSACRDFVDVRDVARAAALAALAPDGLPGVLNIGGGTARPARAVARTLARTSGFHGQFEERGDGSERSTGVSWQCADITAAARELGWRPHHTFEESLADLWAEHGAAPGPGIR